MDVATPLGQQNVVNTSTESSPHVDASATSVKRQRPDITGAAEDSAVPPSKRLLQTSEGPTVDAAKQIRSNSTINGKWVRSRVNAKELADQLGIEGTWHNVDGIWWFHFKSLRGVTKDRSDVFSARMLVKMLAHFRDGKPPTDSVLCKVTEAVKTALHLPLKLNEHRRPHGLCHFMFKKCAATDAWIDALNQLSPNSKSPIIKASEILIRCLYAEESDTFVKLANNRTELIPALKTELVPEPTNTDKEQTEQPDKDKEQNDPRLANAHSAWYIMAEAVGLHSSNK